LGKPDCIILALSWHALRCVLHWPQEHQPSGWPEAPCCIVPVANSYKHQPFQNSALQTADIWRHAVPPAEKHTLRSGALFGLLTHARDSTIHGRVIGRSWVLNVVCPLLTFPLFCMWQDGIPSKRGRQRRSRALHVVKKHCAELVPVSNATALLEEGGHAGQNGIGLRSGASLRSEKIPRSPSVAHEGAQQEHRLILAAPQPRNHLQRQQTL